MEKGEAMRKIIFAAIIFYVSIASLGYALEVETHKAINEYIANNNMNAFSLDAYLKKQLGIQGGIQENIKTSGLRPNTLKVWEWIRDGGEYEDKPPYFPPYVRSTNHFHNPLAPSLSEAGFTGIWDTHVLSGDSAILWAQKPKGVQCSFFRVGCYSWYDVRDYYFNAMTAKVKDIRSADFAETFRGLGQLMHLIEDQSVPEYTRNEGER